MSEGPPTPDAGPANARSRRASAKGGAPERRSLLEKIPLPLRMGLYGVSFLTAILGLLPWAALRLEQLLPDWKIDLPAAVRVAGAMLLAAALITYVGSAAVLSRRGRGAYVEFDPPRQLVTDGPFAWCRNPIAGCVLLMLLGLGLALSSIGVLLLFVLALPVAHAQVVLLEEPLLRKRFGQAYEEHCRRVPRWIPRCPIRTTRTQRRPQPR